MLIESYEKTDSGYICEAYFITEGAEGSSFYSLNGEEIYRVTKDNFAWLKEQFAKYRFDFTYHGDGRLTLSGLKTLHLPE